jgi:anti-sigma regulatory factor (Ser/Thr protein kinase)
MIAVRPGDHGSGFSSERLGFTEETRSFPYELDSARAARHYVTARLAMADESLSGDVSIVVTELAANAVRHARSAFTVTIARSAHSIRIAVQDNAPLVPGADGGQVEVKQGHGLSVVAELARRWGVDRRPGGKMVWAELPVLPRQASLGGRAELASEVQLVG